MMHSRGMPLVTCCVWKDSLPPTGNILLFYSMITVLHPDRTNDLSSQLSKLQNVQSNTRRQLKEPVRSI